MWAVKINEKQQRVFCSNSQTARQKLVARLALLALLYIAVFFFNVFSFTVGAFFTCRFLQPFSRFTDSANAAVATATASAAVGDTAETARKTWQRENQCCCYMLFASCFSSSKIVVVVLSLGVLVSVAVLCTAPKFSVSAKGWVWCETKHWKCSLVSFSASHKLHIRPADGFFSLLPLLFFSLLLLNGKKLLCCSFSKQLHVCVWSKSVW